MEGFQLKDVFEILGLSATPATVAAVGYILYDKLKGRVDIVVDAVKKLDFEIHNNGFVRKDMIAEKQKVADEVHDALEKRIELLEKRL